MCIRDRSSEDNLPAIDSLTEIDRDLQQALVVERTLMFIRQASEEASKMRKAYEANQQQIKERWLKYQAIPASSQERRLWPGFEDALSQWEKTSGEVLALPGSCGQPRDGNPAACCGLFDTAAGTLTLLRVAYDHHAASAKIVAAGLPESLARRLTEGR